jgi:hypothetical protein
MIIHSLLTALIMKLRGIILTLFRVRTAAKRRTGLDELKNNCNTVIAAVSSRLVTPFNSVIARAASKMTISVLCLRQLSRKSKNGLSPV